MDGLNVAISCVPCDRTTHRRTSAASHVATLGAPAAKSNTNAIDNNQNRTWFTYWPAAPRSPCPMASTALVRFFRDCWLYPTLIAPAIPSIASTRHCAVSMTSPHFSKGKCWPLRMSHISATPTMASTNPIVPRMELALFASEPVDAKSRQDNDENRHGVMRREPTRQDAIDGAGHASGHRAGAATRGCRRGDAAEKVIAGIPGRRHRREEARGIASCCAHGCLLAPRLQYNGRDQLLPKFDGGRAGERRAIDIKPDLWHLVKVNRVGEREVLAQEIPGVDALGEVKAPEILLPLQRRRARFRELRRIGPEEDVERIGGGELADRDAGGAIKNLAGHTQQRTGQGRRFPLGKSGAGAADLRHLFQPPHNVCIRWVVRRILRHLVQLTHQRHGGRHGGRRGVAGDEIGGGASGG